MTEENKVKDKEKKKLVESITKLTQLVKQLRSERYLQMVENRKKFLFYNFIAGIARGVGWALGTTVVVGLIVWVLSQIVDVPLLGDLVDSIIGYLQENRNN